MEEDRFSSLPDDILLSIVSLLQFKEAARTSILSRRWVHLWKGTGRLDFDVGAFFSGLNMRHDLSPGEQGHLFADWVCQVLNYSPRSATLDEFRFSTTDDRRIDISSQVVDGWMNFALQKQVKKLDLWARGVSGWRYPFPSLALRNANCKSLVVLRMTSVEVTGDDIAHVAVNCPYLEELMVWYSTSLIDLDIKTPMSRLKLFDVGRCSKVNRLLLCAPNLMSFSYSGNNIEMMPLKKDVLCLDKLSIGWDYLFFFLFKPNEWQSYQVKRLELDLYLFPEVLYECNLHPHRIVKFGHLRELYIRFEEEYFEGVLWLTSFVKASPLLHSLHVEMIWRHYKYSTVAFPEALTLAMKRFKIHPIEVCPHNLRNVELTECYASPGNIKLIIYLVENATCLEKLTIHHTNKFDYNREEFVKWIMEMKTQMLLETELVII